METQLSIHPCDWGLNPKPLVSMNLFSFDTKKKSFRNTSKRQSYKQQKSIFLLIFSLFSFRGECNVKRDYENFIKIYDEVQ